MAKIRANHSKFEAAAKKIDLYVESHKKEMKKAGDEVNLLAATWKGTDFDQFKKQWETLDDKGSTSDMMIKALENYGTFLRYSAEKYKKVQTDAINRANKITYF